MNYEEAVEELFQRKNNREKAGLKPVKEVLENLNRPDKDSKVVLVGGTNGKSSTVEMISACMQQLGFKTGTFRSPHLVKPNERISIDGEDISDNEFVRIYEEVRSTSGSEKLNFFEFLTVMAYLYFSKRKVDYSIVEVGIGGRLDATNVAENQLAVITNVQKDHTDYLGKTRKQIAREQAEIIPENRDVVTKDFLEPIEQVAQKRGSNIHRPHSLERVGKTFGFKDQNFRLPVKGDFQKENLEAALKAVEVIETVPENLDRAFSRLECRGRMDIIDHNPKYIHDGAHNPAALRKILPELSEDFICVFNSTKKDKIEEMLSIIEKKASKIYLTESNIFKALPASKIKEKVVINHEVEPKPSKAVDKALEEADKNGEVVVTGSLYLVGDIKKARNE